MLAEESGKVRGIGKRQLLRDVLDRLRGENELALGFGQHALADQMAGGDAGCALDVIVEPIDRHAEFLGVEAELMLAVEEFVDQRAQLRDGGVGGLQGDAAARRATPTAISDNKPRMATR